MTGGVSSACGDVSCSFLAMVLGCAAVLRLSPMGSCGDHRLGSRMEAVLRRGASRPGRRSLPWGVSAPQGDLVPHRTGPDPDPIPSGQTAARLKVLAQVDGALGAIALAVLPGPHGGEPGMTRTLRLILKAVGARPATALGAEL